MSLSDSLYESRRAALLQSLALLGPCEWTKGEHPWLNHVVRSLESGETLDTPCGLEELRQFSCAGLILLEELDGRVFVTLKPHGAGFVQMSIIKI